MPAMPKRPKVGRYAAARKRACPGTRACPAGIPGPGATAECPPSWTSGPPAGAALARPSSPPLLRHCPLPPPPPSRLSAPTTERCPRCIPSIESRLASVVLVAAVLVVAAEAAGSQHSRMRPLCPAVLSGSESSPALAQCSPPSRCWRPGGMASVQSRESATPRCMLPMLPQPASPYTMLPSPGQLATKQHHSRYWAPEQMCKSTPVRSLVPGPKARRAYFPLSHDSCSIVR